MVLIIINIMRTSVIIASIISVLIIIILAMFIVFLFPVLALRKSAPDAEPTLQTFLCPMQRALASSPVGPSTALQLCGSLSASPSVAYRQIHSLCPLNRALAPVAP